MLQGMWALWAIGVFCTDNNVLAAGHFNSNRACKRGEQLAVQVVGSLAIMCWACTTSALIIGSMRICLIDLRVSDEIEVRCILYFDVCGNWSALGVLDECAYPGQSCA